MSKLKGHLERIAIKRSILSGLLLISVAAATIGATSLIQYFYSRRVIREGAKARAEGQLESTNHRIMNVVNLAETAVRNSEWIANWCLERPDSLSRVTERIVVNNPVVVGSAFALVPGYYKDHRLLAPYTFKDAGSGTVSQASLATEDYDYPSKEWFREALDKDEGYWSEPYSDVGGGDILMTTFSMPIKDAEGVPSAVLTADVSLDWLTDMVGGTQIYPSAFSMVISRTGHIMVCSEKDLIMHETIGELTAAKEDSTVLRRLNQAMLSGEKGSLPLHYDGRKMTAYFAPVERTDWSMAIIIPDSEIMGEMNKVSRKVSLLQLLGLLMLGLILLLAYRNQRQFAAVSDKKKKMENDLRIASEIQMSMIPKVFPPFPERKDIDLSASLVPAKEVGGDLYDYFIRDGKLFFCIGDVSGKGVPAALVMAVTRSLFRTLSSHEDSPRAIVTSMNESMVEMNEKNMFVTFFTGVLDLATGHLRYCNAGHNAPLSLTNKIQVLPVVPNLPLGVISGVPFEEQETDLEYDDALFLYTDGITEAENVNHELFGLDRVIRVLHKRRDAHSHLKAMEEAVAGFVGEAPQSDDLTMLFLHYTNEAPSSEKVRHLVLNNDIRQIPRLAEFVESIAEEAGLQPGTTMSINLALEEAVTNVMMYAYPEKEEGLVDIEAKIGRKRLGFTVIDSGVAFDPTKAPEVDTTAGAESRKVGGLGIHMVRSIMDTLKYKRVGDKNILSMTKNI